MKLFEDSAVPVKNPDVTVREEMEEDGNFILFNSENELILVINPTGKFILDNCDGEKSVNQLVADIKEKFSVSEDMDLAGVVGGYLETLHKAQLITVKEVAAIV